MRTSHRLALALLSALLAAPAALAEDPNTVELVVGASRRLGGCGGRCDDLSVVTITQDCNATLTALKAGQTTCSAATGSSLGLRVVYRVVVVPKDPSGANPARTGP